MTFPKDLSGQNTYINDLETRMDSAIQKASPFVLVKGGEEPNQKDWEDAWVLDGNALPIPKDKLLHWYDDEQEMLRGIYSIINDSFTTLYGRYDRIGVDWNDSQGGVGRVYLFRWELEIPYFYWEDDSHIISKANKYDYDTDTLTADQMIRIYMDGTIEDLGAWVESFQTLRVSDVRIKTDNTWAEVSGLELQIAVAPSATPDIVALEDFGHVDLSNTGDATGSTGMVNGGTTTSSGWKNTSAMDTSRGYLISSLSIDINSTLGAVQHYWGCSSVPASAGNADGYEIVFDKSAQTISLYFNTALLHSQTYAIAAASLPFRLYIDFDNDRIVLYDGSNSDPSFLFDYQDIPRVLPGTNMGLGGYKTSAVSGTILITLSVGAIPTINRTRIASDTGPEFIMFDFVAYVRYNHTSGVFTLYHHDSPVPEDYITNEAYLRWQEVYAASDWNNYPDLAIMDLFQFQEETGVKFREDSLSEIYETTYRDAPHFQGIGEVGANGWSSSHYIAASPNGERYIVAATEVFIVTSEIGLSTGKIYRLNAWSDGGDDVIAVYNAVGDGVLNSFTIDLSTLSIPSDYDALMFKFSANQDASTDDIELVFNADGGANYSSTTVIANTAGADSFVSSITNTKISIPMAYLRTTQTDARDFLAYIYQFRDDEAYKSVFFPIQYERTTLLNGYGGTWRNASPITTITVGHSNSPTPFASGWYFTLYAIRTKGREYREGNLDDYNMA